MPQIQIRPPIKRRSKKPSATLKSLAATVGIVLGGLSGIAIGGLVIYVALDVLESKPRPVAAVQPKRPLPRPVVPQRKEAAKPRRPVVAPEPVSIVPAKPRQEAPAIDLPEPVERPAMPDLLKINQPKLLDRLPEHGLSDIIRDLHAELTKIKNAGGTNAQQEQEHYEMMLRMERQLRAKTIRFRFTVEDVVVKDTALAKLLPPAEFASFREIRFPKSHALENWSKTKILSLRKGSVLEIRGEPHLRVERLSVDRVLDVADFPAPVPDVSYHYYLHLANYRVEVRR